MWSLDSDCRIRMLIASNCECVNEWRVPWTDYSCCLPVTTGIWLQQPLWPQLGLTGGYQKMDRWSHSLRSLNTSKLSKKNYWISIFHSRQWQMGPEANWTYLWCVDVAQRMLQYHFNAVNQWKVHIRGAERWTNAWPWRPHDELCVQENEQETQQGSEMLLLNTPTHTHGNNRAKINDHGISVCVRTVCIGAPEMSAQ